MSANPSLYYPYFMMEPQEQFRHLSLDHQPQKQEQVHLLTVDQQQHQEQVHGLMMYHHQQQQQQQQQVAVSYINPTPTYSFPTGYRFRPSDEELIMYLERKLQGTLQFDRPFLDIELYSYDPQVLIDMHKKYVETDQESWYFFTSRDRKYRNGSRPDRAAKNGYWKATGADIAIEENGVIIGYKKVLDFCTGGYKDKLNRTEWKMHEFLTKDQKFATDLSTINNQHGMRLNDCVLCKVYKNHRKLKKKVDSDDD